MRMFSRISFLLALIAYKCQSFSPTPAFIPATKQNSHDTLQEISQIQNHRSRQRTSCSTPTSLYNGVIIDVDDNFFTIAFFSIGLFYSLGKAYNRYLLEEVAFEQRRIEARELRLERDPTLSELEIRREESAEWPSVYAQNYRREGEVAERDGDSRKRSRVSVLDWDQVREEDNDGYAMTDDEIASFESRYGVQYDPYFDEGYEESDLPTGKYKEDKSYGDRRYENGEVFYKEQNSGLFYRQGSRPRQKKFWDLNSS